MRKLKWWLLDHVDEISVVMLIMSIVAMCLAVASITSRGITCP
jgi:hypothetical protein